MSEKNILLHRISYRADVSWPLLNIGYLSIGWSDYVNDETDEYINARNFHAFQEFVFTNEKSRSRHCLMRFVHLNKGDWVVVPHPYMFSIYEVEEPAMTVRHLSLPATFQNAAKMKIIKNERGLLVYGTPVSGLSNPIDLGFMVKVKPIMTHISRSQYADAALAARLKTRPTNVSMNDLKKNIEQAIEAVRKNQPINLYENIVENAAQVVLEALRKSLTPGKFEKLVQWYFQKIGATDVYIPAKNPQGKQDYEDADVVATFESLKTIVYVQVKKHEGTTGTWGIEQIKRYADIHGKQEDYSVCRWVISSADFSEEAVLKAAENDVRWIDGKQFAIMLMNAGISNLEKVIL